MNILEHVFRFTKNGAKFLVSCIIYLISYPFESKWPNKTTKTPKDSNQNACSLVHVNMPVHTIVIWPPMQTRPLMRSTLTSWQALLSNRSQMISHCGKNKEVTHEPKVSVSGMFLPHFDVVCNPLLNKRTAKWNLFVLHKIIL